MRSRINISVTPETEARLKRYASDCHKTVSQAITDWIWFMPVRESPVVFMDEKGRTERRRSVMGTSPKQG